MFYDEKEIKSFVTSSSKKIDKYEAECLASFNKLDLNKADFETFIGETSTFYN